MKKKSYRPPAQQDTTNDPELEYKVAPPVGLRKKETVDKQQKIFKRTSTPKDFPNNCVTLDTFFSDLEDYIHNHEAL